MTALQTKNDPAAIAVAPGQGSNNLGERNDMNEATNTTASAVRPAPPQEWDLLKAIYTYKGSWNLYMARSLDDDDTPRIYEESLELLETWSHPAMNYCEAQAAIDLAAEFIVAGDSGVTLNMVNAVKGWMQNQAGKGRFA